ncbi:MAG: DHH family phosphoesterase [Acidimicrobiia bacterium]|nr:DHH family phosphoesterase [Acidimicrobiia bacterium]
MDALDRAAGVIEGSELVALACHVTPDGDALGSMLAMHLMCRSQGKASVASWPEPFVVAPHYTFLPGLDLVTKPADFPDAPPVMVTFDCGSLHRLNELAEPAREAGELIVVDHHATNEHYGTINLLDADAAASAVMVYRLAKRLGWPIKRDVAICLYTGIVTDTGRFQYSNTSPEVLEMATELSRFDLPIADMSRRLFEEHRFAYLQLVAAVLQRAELDLERRFVATWITNEDLIRFGVEMDEAEGLIDIVRRTAEADVSCVLKEGADGTRVSLRSVTDFDVAAIAMRFAGGGHRAAAGFTDPRPIADVLADIRAQIPIRS